MTSNQSSSKSSDTIDNKFLTGVLSKLNSDAFNMLKKNEIDQDAFEKFLKSFYYDKVVLSIESIADVLELGKEYPLCREICERILLNTLCIATACKSYGLATRFKLEKLIEKCEKMVAEETEEVFKSTAFIKSERSILSKILKLDSLSCGESIVFRSCVEWVRARSGEEIITRQIFHEYLGDKLYDIRFRSMSNEELTTLPSTCGELFSNEERQENSQLIESEDYVPELFNPNPRLNEVEGKPPSHIIYKYRTFFPKFKVIFFFSTRHSPFV